MTQWVILVLWRSFLLLAFNWGNPNYPPPLKKTTTGPKGPLKGIVERIRDSDIVWFNE